MVRVIIAFDLMNEGDTYEAESGDGRTQSLINSGYIVPIFDIDEIMKVQNESELGADEEKPPRGKARTR